MACRKATLVVGMVALAALAASAVWLPALGNALTARAEPRRADAIVLTYAAMMLPEGLDEAEELYRAEWAPTIVLSDFRIEQRGWDTDRLQPIARRRLLRRGIPETALVEIAPVPAHELNEAELLRDLFAARGWGSILLVVRDYRTLRTTATLRRVAGAARLDLIPRPVQAPDVSLSTWWTTREGVAAVTNEWPRIGFYRLRGWL
ncbi:MAG TPA: hypothetical protein VG370_02715 [Chloroflexota bacterium]|jgi:uncharacterized SAM-binding protein YcdF (DUF218 family)|nr:hypothetical protein [Chloroflexota bacterium]